MRILVTGATGFVGSAVVGEALAAGHAIRILARNPRSPDSAAVEYFTGNVAEPSSLAGCMDGIEAVIHLVGIICERGTSTFQRIHVEGTRNLLAEAQRGGIRRFIHMSALGTRPDARSRYHRTKWAAEGAVRGSGLDWTIFRPSVIYGPRDEFVNRFAQMLRPPWRYLQLFTLPLIGGGNSRLQPIPAEDVGRAFVRAVTNPTSIGKAYDLCGPTPLLLREILATIADVMGARSLLVPVPIVFGRLIARFCETVMRKPLLTRDQLIMLQEDNVGDPSSARRDFGITPPEFREGIAQYLGPSQQ